MSALPLAAAPVITEIMAANDAAVLDEDGDASDWLEIFNPDATAADLTGWSLSDNAGNLYKWTFPNGVVLEPGAFLRVWASSKDRKGSAAALHTNFALSADGEYLALTPPGGLPPASAFTPAFPALRDDESYGVPFETTTLIAPNATALVQAPARAGTDAAWRQPGFAADATWLEAPLSLGFGMPSPGFFVEERLSSAAITSITTAQAVIDGSNAVDRLTGLRSIINFVSENGPDYRFSSSQPFLHGGAPERFALRAKTSITLPSGGQWTFHVNSSDGFALYLGSSLLMSFNGLREATDSFVTRTVPAGTHELTLFYYGNAGMKSVELSAAKGAHSGFSEAFQLIGNTASGGVAAMAPPGSGLSMVTTDLSSAMLNVSASAYVRLPFTLIDPAWVETLDLAVAYNDGFVAYLNGTEVARRHAPAAPAHDSTASEARDPSASLAPETIPLSVFRPHLAAGENVLAFHALNASAADASFYLAPELKASRRVPGAHRFFSAATPGKANTAAGSLGRLEAPAANPPRGHLSAATDITLTTSQPGAVIRYTTNGSMPTLANGQTYTAPIPVSATTVLRAAAFLEDYETSEAATHTYLFLSDVIRQGATPYGAKPGPEWPNPGAINGQVIQYGMDPTIVNNTNATIGGEAATLAALRSLPAVCLTVDLPDLFHPTTGIYVNAEEHGRSWERPASMELLAKEGETEPGFQSGCGVRMRGGVSRRDSNPKHGWRVFFRKEYGAGKLRYPVYGNTATDEFDAFDIQSAQNYSWSRDGNTSYNALREIWSRDTQLAMGQTATHGRFVHLYINGVYWGLHQIQERAIAPFGASYLGGNKEDYDVIKSAGLDGSHTVEATDGYFTTLPDGTDSAWKKMWAASRAAYFINRDRNPAAPATALASTQQEKLAAYYKLQALQADGRAPTGEAPLLDVDNLIDYIILLFFTRNSDSSISAFYENARPNNFYCLRNRLGALGFVSIIHDAEHTFDASGAADRWGPWQTDTGNYWNNINYSNPQYIHQDLSASPEYRMRFADRIYQHFYNDGAMVTAKNLARFDARAAEIETAVVAESARWGDAQATPARTVANWRTARNATRSAISGRYNAFLSEARTRGFYPSISPPTLSPRGGLITAGAEVALSHTNGSGVIYYTTDGTDPRPAGGGFVPQILVPEFADASYLVPSENNGGSTLAQWTTAAAPPNAASWTQGPMGFGFAPARTPATDFTPFIKTNLQAQLQPEGGTATGTFYVRIPFTLSESQLASLSTLRLKLRYDDALIGYLNGVEIVRKTVGAAFVPAWNSVSGSARTDANAITQEEVILSPAPGLLAAGENMLAFHVMNSTAANNDMLFSPQVEFDSFSAAQGQAYTGPFTLARGAVVKARVLEGTAWSALEEAEFSFGTQPAAASNLVVSEFCYAPAAPRTPAEAAYEAAEFEFIELLNISPYTVDLAGVVLSEAVDFVFPAGSAALLPPGGRLVLSPNPPAFAARYGAAAQPVAGPYSGKLNNSGESIRITAADHSSIKLFTYSPQAPWPAAAANAGHSLVLRAAMDNPDHMNPANWRASAAPDGRPALPDDEDTPGGLTYEAWKTAHGFTDDAADPFQTGLPLFAAYAFGASETARGADVLPVAGLAALGEGLTPTLTFRQRALVEDVMFHLESSPSLQTDSWQGVTDAFEIVSEMPHEDGTSTVTYRARQPLPAEPLFFRVRVTSQ